MKAIIQFKYKNILVLWIFLLLNLITNAQFTIIESFRKSNMDSRIVLGGNATLTSGNVDPVNDGWLRLTPATGDQRGYAYVNSSFPTTLGVIMEFEYKTWRDFPDLFYHGADGFSVFLFDAAITNFSTGGYGGSLGYAPNSDGGTPTGLSGGYIGIGFDEYGNFSNPTEGRIGGISGLRPNSVTLRGPTTSNALTTNAYLTSTQLQTDPTNNTNSVDYNTITSNRPTDATFYRKVKLTIMPTGTGNFTITVYWKTSTSGSYTQLLTYTTSTAPPANLKVGFAASTGGGINYHEIRNIDITTTGNVRVSKSVDKANANLGDQLTYTVNVINDTPASLNNINFTDVLNDGNGSPLVLGSSFNINSITFSNNGNSSTTASGFTNGVAKISGFTNTWTTSLNMVANGTATFNIVGTVLAQPIGNVVVNSVNIDPTPSGITDTDITNNSFSVSTTVLTPNVDFVINKTLNNPCADSNNGNTFTITVTNMGSTASAGNKKVTVTDIIPSGLTVQSAGGTGWTTSLSGNTYTFTRTESLNSTYSYPPVGITVKPGPGVLSWINTATLTYEGIEANTANNSSSVTLYSQPSSVILSTVTQPTCTVPSGSFTITNYDGSYSYTFTPSTGVTHSGGTVTAPAGTYTVTATLGTCTSPASANVVVNAQPATPVQPTLSAVTQPTCTVATGSFTITNYDIAYTYSVIPSAGVTVSGSTITAPAGTYTVTATLGACTSPASASVIVNAQPATPVQPTLSAVTQPTCTIATGSFTISNYDVSYTYSVSPSAGTTVSGNTITAPAGTYTVTATNGSGCTSLASANVVVNAQPATPALSIAPASQTICSGATATLTVSGTNLGTVNWSSDHFGITGTGTNITSGTLTNKGTTPWVILVNAVANNGSCTAKTNATITVLPEPRVIAAPGSLVVCSYETPHFALNSILTGTLINWQLINNIDSSIVSSGSGTDSITLFSTPIPSGSYTLKVTGTKDGCTSRVLTVPLVVN